MSNRGESSVSVKLRILSVGNTGVTVSTTYEFDGETFFFNEMQKIIIGVYSCGDRVCNEGKSDVLC